MTLPTFFSSPLSHFTAQLIKRNKPHKNRIVAGQMVSVFMDQKDLLEEILNETKKV